MGARKNKWTQEEEAALRAGVLKHGAGKWRIIAKDPEFKDVLSLRSNIDLKDKWRNLNAADSGFGSREKARLALKNIQLTPTTAVDNNPIELTPTTDVDDNPIQQAPTTDIDNNPIQLTPTPEIDNNPLLPPTVVESHEEIIDVKPLAISSGTSQDSSSKKPITRLDTVVLEAITSLKEPSGSNRSSIAMYIEDQYSTPSNFKRALTVELKSLTTSEKLVKVDDKKYMIAPCSFISEAKEMSGVLLLEGGQKGWVLVQEGGRRDSSMLDRYGVEVTRSQIHEELAMMENMGLQEAAETAAEAVAAAEAALAEAEQAASEAQAAEAAAKAAEASANEAMVALQTIIASRQMVRA